MNSSEEERMANEYMKNNFMEFIEGPAIGTREALDEHHIRMAEVGIDGRATLKLTNSILRKIVSSPEALDAQAREAVRQFKNPSLILAIDEEARKRGISEDKVNAFWLSSFRTEEPMDPRLTQDERESVELIRKIARHAIQQGYLKSMPEDAPDNSTWGAKMKAAAKPKMCREMRGRKLIN